MKPNRIHILGTSGSGKTYLSKKLSEKLKIKIYDLDDIFFIRKYDKKRDIEKRKQLLKKIVKRKTWIIEGVYSTWVEESIKKSDLVIMLDPAYYVLAYRLILRFFKRKVRKNRDTLKDLWMLLKFSKSYHNKDLSGSFQGHKELIDRHKVEFVYLKNKRELNWFLEEFKIK